MEAATLHNYFILALEICFFPSLKMVACFCALKEVLYSHNILLITLQKILNLGDIMTQVKTLVSNFTFICHRKTHTHTISQF